MSEAIEVDVYALWNRVLKSCDSHYPIEEFTNDRTVPPMVTDFWRESGFATKQNANKAPQVLTDLWKAINPRKNQTQAKYLAIVDNRTKSITAMVIYHLSEDELRGFWSTSMEKMLTIDNTLLSSKYHLVLLKILLTALVTKSIFAPDSVRILRMHGDKVSSKIMFDLGSTLISAHFGENPVIISGTQLELAYHYVRVLSDIRTMMDDIFTTGLGEICVTPDNLDVKKLYSVIVEKENEFRKVTRSMKIPGPVYEPLGKKAYGPTVSTDETGTDYDKYQKYKAKYLELKKKLEQKRL